MKPYVLVKGTATDIESFEDKISEVLAQGFEFNSDLITQVVTTEAGKPEVLLFQPMILADDLDFDDLDELDEEEIDFDEEVLVEED